MSVDLDAIAQRGRCEVSSLRLALPLLEQGYTPPFLARYRRDELGDLDEASLWALSSAMQAERHVASRRDELHQAWEQTSLRDPAIGHAITKSNSLRMLARLGRRLKSEASDNVSDATRLAVRVLNPQKGDGSDFAAIAAKVDGITDASAAVAGLDDALAKRLAGDPRIIAAAVRWLVKNARIHIVAINDPHTSAGGDQPQDAPANDRSEQASGPTAEPQASAQPPTTQMPTTQMPTTVAAAPQTAAATDQPASDAAEATVAGESATAESTPPATAPDASASTDAAATGPTPAETVTPTPPPTDPNSPVPAAATGEASQPDATGSGSQSSDPENSDPGNSDPGNNLTADKAGNTTAAAKSASSVEPAPAESAPTKSAPAKSAPAPEAGKAGKPPKSAAKGAKKQKKISPRQRRRRWLVSVLKPLAGKRFQSDKLSSFQVVMLGRALRSQVAQCSFEYDATKLVAELQRTAGNVNRQIDQTLREIVLKHEAAIREAAESAWWDDLQERASARLVTITAEHLRRHVNRGGVQAKVVMSIDAIGPRTAATSIVSSDGRLLHCEDLPCQLSSALRAQAVTKMGELIHTYHVDLIVISNGPARRASMIALGDLVSQSPEKSIHWTLADRSGADAYASSGIADQEMRSTPRRFRAAAWLAFSILQPAQALAKVDPLKLRLSSFQRELSDEALSRTLEDVMTSGASRGGVDINSAPTSWLARLPGMNSHVAEAIDATRRQSLFESRESVTALEQWESTTQSRQAVPFLRVFGSQEVLDGTLVHPEDYALARKLAKSLEIELPPDAPPGYTPPDYSASEPVAQPDQLSEATPKPDTKIEVEDFSAPGQEAAEFAIETAQESGSEAQPGEAADQEPQAESDQGVPTTDAASPAAAEAASAAESASAAEAASTATTDSEVTDGESATGQATVPPAATESSLEPGSDGDPSVGADSGSATPDSPAEVDDQVDGETGSAAASDSDSTDQATRSTSPVPDLPEPIKRPLPETAKIDKCVKEWQIGARRAHQLVHWLCDPFGDSDATGNPPAVLSNMPSSKGLKPGDQVIGVVVGVMPFGVFLELAPDCSGLIHVSRISDSYVEDLHEAIQVGDVVTAWVTGIDEKRKRVALSAVSPAREAEIEAAKRARHERPRGRSQRGGPPRGGPPRAVPSRGGGERAPSQGSERGADKRSARPASKGGARGKDQARGGRPRDGGGRSRDARGRGRERKPESYRVVSKKEAKPITDAMQKGEEPLRSFGDLMQFFDSAEKPEKPVVAETVEESAVSTPESATADNDQPVASHEEAADKNAANENAAATTDATADVNQPAPEDSSQRGSQTPAETKQNSDQLDTDPPTESSSPADASTS